jgi:lipopolysaccharide transport system ATP-binding protein
METVISIKNLGKHYKIVHRDKGYVALRDVISNIIFKPISYAKIKAKKIIRRETKEEFWALRDINFEINKGEIIGVIGRNGAGKSTLLKILTGITPPTTGEIKLKGKIASLLEVGTGFHPELTGRENIFLNGAIMGMTQREIEKKFDDIVEFSGIEKFLDTPVKRYSSGMYVRLAFSVAAHLEPDILLVDEVLAVGDAEFQKKCLGKMDEVTKTAGRTIFFVSHNMQAIERLCTKCILLDGGKIIKMGKTKEVVDYYLNNEQKYDPTITFPEDLRKSVNIRKISFINNTGKATASLPANEPFTIRTEFDIRENVDRATFSAMIYTQGDLMLLSFEADKKKKLSDYKPGKYVTDIKIPALIFNVGNYYVDVSIQRPGIEYLDRKQNINFELTDEGHPRLTIPNLAIMGKMGTLLDYETIKK